MLQWLPSRVTVTITCYIGYHHVLPWLTVHVLPWLTVHVLPWLPSRVTMVTIMCYHAYHHVLPWLPSCVTMVTITCSYCYHNLLQWLLTCCMRCCSTVVRLPHTPPKAYVTYLATYLSLGWGKRLFDKHFTDILPMSACFWDRRRFWNFTFEAPIKKMTITHNSKFLNFHNKKKFRKVWWWNPCIKLQKERAIWQYTNLQVRGVAAERQV